MVCQFPLECDAGEFPERCELYFRFGDSFILWIYRKYRQKLLSDSNDIFKGYRYDENFVAESVTFPIPISSGKESKTGISVWISVLG